MLLRDANHVCWEAIQLAFIDFPNTWATRAQDAATGACGHHGQR